MLEIKSLYKTYGEAQTRALSDFSLTLTEGEFVSLIGPSGCGKTTALRIVTGLLEPTAGEVFLEGTLRRWAG